MGLCAKLNCCASKSKKKAAKDDGVPKQNDVAATNGGVKDGAGGDAAVANGKEAPVYAKVNKKDGPTSLLSSPVSGLSASSSTSSPPRKAGFLVSFVVDSRGSAMTGCRGSGIRLIIPPGAVEQPVRVTCRFVRSHGHQVLVISLYLSDRSLICKLFKYILKMHIY